MAKKAAKKKVPAEKAPAKKAPAKKAPSKKAPAKKAAKKATKKGISKNAPVRKRNMVKRHPLLSHLGPPPTPAATTASIGGGKPKKLTASFLKKQRQKLLDLRDTLVDQMNGVARDTLGKGEDNHDSSAFGMHQADAGSDAYDRDFALNLLSQEQDALHQIEEALLRIDGGEYGVCEGSGVQIPIARLEAMPFARRTVDFQEKLDKEEAAGMRRSPATTLFGIDEKEASPTASKDD
jgi:RNA polymerase-binding transcription factor DksA